MHRGATAARANALATCDIIFYQMPTATRERTSLDTQLYDCNRVKPLLAAVSATVSATTASSVDAHAYCLLRVTMFYAHNQTSRVLPLLVPPLHARKRAYARTMCEHAPV